MGTFLWDQYSLLHFAVGVVAYFWGASFLQWFVIHGIFELLENTEAGMHFIRMHLDWFWPGGKRYRDAPINVIGDQIAAMLGWLVPWALFGPVHGIVGSTKTSNK